MRLSGCPSLTLAPSGDALKPDPVAHVDEHCVACGHCGEVADAAVLCPSFYKAHTVRNPSTFERMRALLRDTLLELAASRRATATRQARAVPDGTAAVNKARSIHIAILALGGQGGGVLVDWIVALGMRAGWWAQATSVAAWRSAPGPPSTTWSWSSGRATRSR